MGRDRDAFSVGLEKLLDLQAELKSPPKRKDISPLVHKLVKEAGLEGDARKSYYVLLATCALMKKEAMYNNFKNQKENKKHGKVKRSNHR